MPRLVVDPRFRAVPTLSLGRYLDAGHTLADAARRHGGFVQSVRCAVGDAFLGAKWERDLERTRSLQGLCAYYGRPLVPALAWRADVYRESPTTGVWPGFNPAWLMRQPAGPARAVVRAWELAGWRVELPRHMDAAWWESLWTGTAPYVYAAALSDSRVVRVRGALTDLRRPDYRAWALRHLAAACDRAGTRSVVLVVKERWHAHPSEEWSQPSAPIRPDSPLQPTPYGPGEFEAALNALVVEAVRDHGIFFLLSSLKRSSGYWTWLSDEVRTLVLGERAEFS